MEIMLSEDFDGDIFRQLIVTKVDIARRIINMRAYYKDPKLDAFILDEHTSVRMYTAIRDYVVKDKNSSRELMSLFRRGAATGSFEWLEDKTTGKNMYLVYVLYDLYDTLKKSTELIEEMKVGLVK